ncbi:nitroreductase [uncultured Roseovarius sp.]|uniref:nitroreductase n=1 Tax=uncultured Roseovarius sp. TaxID=293344 RepID=UPI00262E4E4C|nr:nitroreductase [uncultured Roseovarius sp.]
MDDNFDALRGIFDARYSCRAFRPDPLPDETIRQIVSTAGRAPSWCNAQPWQVTITRGDETERFRTALLDAVTNEKPNPDFAWPNAYPGATGTRRRICGFQLYESVGIARGDQEARHRQSMENYRLFGAPHVAIISSESDLGAYGALDCGGFVTAFTLAATALGVATIAQASVAAYPQMIRQHFDLPENRLVLCAISFGYADPDHPANGFRTERAGLAEIYDPRG